MSEDPFAFLSGDSLGTYLGHCAPAPESGQRPSNHQCSSSAVQSHGAYGRPPKRSLSSAQSSSFPSASAGSLPAAKRQRQWQQHPNDAGLSDLQYASIVKARELETPQMVSNYIAERKRKYPTRRNVHSKQQLVAAKMRRGQTLTVSEKIQNFTDSTGCKRTPSVFRFLRTPRHRMNLLEQVLRREIDEEHSAILQCFRHLVKHQFFDEETSEPMTRNSADASDASSKAVLEAATDIESDTLTVSSSKCVDTSIATAAMNSQLEIDERVGAKTAKSGEFADIAFEDEFDESLI